MKCIVFFNPLPPSLHIYPKKSVILQNNLSVFKSRGKNIFISFSLQKLSGKALHDKCLNTGVLMEEQRNLLNSSGVNEPQGCVCVCVERTLSLLF